MPGVAKLCIYTYCFIFAQCDSSRMLASSTPTAVQPYEMIKANPPPPNARQSHLSPTAVVLPPPPSIPPPTLPFCLCISRRSASCHVHLYSHTHAKIHTTNVSIIYRLVPLTQPAAFSFFLHPRLYLPTDFHLLELRRFHPSFARTAASTTARFHVVLQISR